MTVEQPNRLAEREKQIRQAEELLAALPQKIGVAKGMFEGRFVADWVFPYPAATRRASGARWSKRSPSSNASATSISIRSGSIARPTSRARSSMDLANWAYWA